MSEMTLQMESESSDSHMYMYTIDEEQLGCKPEMKALDENQGQITKQQKTLDVQKMKSSRRRTQKGDKRHKCDVCGKTFGRSSTLLGHLKIHSGDKRHVCEVCGKAFIYPRDLQIHIRIHTGEKPYKCEECGKEFSQSSNLIVHRGIHTADKPFKCGACGKAFNTSKSLQNHLDKYKCEHFKNLTEKRTCDVCGRIFKVLNGIQTTGERQNTCDNCHRVLSQNGSVTLVWV